MYNSNVKKRKYKSKPSTKNHFSAQQILKEFRIILERYFPDVRQQIRESVTDPRRKKSTHYTIDELIFACVFMYLFRCESRNGFNTQRDYQEFRTNYRKLTKMEAPHMDTVDAVLERIDPQAIQNIQTYLVKMLLRKRVFHKFRFLGKYFRVAIDGSGIFHFDDLPYEHCPYKQSKNGKLTYSQSVVEAKLVCPNGFCISLASEWITNEDGQAKQDCEYKAALRLMDKLKKDYPRLAICVLLDGLFFKMPIITKIMACQWEFIIVWKDKTRFDLQDVVAQTRIEHTTQHLEYTEFPSKHIRYEYRLEWLDEAVTSLPTDLYYIRGDKIEISTDQQEENQYTKFIYITSIPITKSNAREVFNTSRHRWMIENQGFNYQNNSRLALHHKMNRKNIAAIQNYYICLQIAHLLSQLVVLAKTSITQTFGTWKEVWDLFRNFLKFTTDYLPIPLKAKYNLRY